MRGGWAGSQVVRPDKAAGRPDDPGSRRGVAPAIGERAGEPAAARIPACVLRIAMRFTTSASSAATVRRPPILPSASPAGFDPRVGTPTGLGQAQTRCAAADGASIVQCRTGMTPGSPRTARRRRRHRWSARPVRFRRGEKGRLTRRFGAAYTAPPDAVRKKNGAGRTDFPRFRKVDLAKAEVLDFSSAGNYESDY